MQAAIKSSLGHVEGKSAPRQATQACRYTYIIYVHIYIYMYIYIYINRCVRTLPGSLVPWKLYLDVYARSGKTDLPDLPHEVML